MADNRSRRLVSLDQDVDDEQLSSWVASLLGGLRLLSLATVDPATARPHVNTCYFAELQDYRLTVLTPPSTRHGSYIAQEANCAVNIFSTEHCVGDPITGVQLAGIARPADDESEAPEAYAAYARKHAKFSEFAPSLSVIQDTFESRFYVFEIAGGQLLDEPHLGPERYVRFEIESS